MDLHSLVNEALADLLGSGDNPGSIWPRFAPELILCGTIIVMLVVRVFKIARRFDAFYLAALGALVGLYYCAPWKLLVEPEAFARVELFSGMLVYDGLTVFMRTVLLSFALLFAVFTKLSGVPDREDSPDFYCLILGGTVGMCLMASANHLLMIFLAVEMASVPSYALAGLLRGNRKASEAALKYSIYGAGAAGVMLYGISLLAGLLNTAHLPTMAVQLAANLPQMNNSETMVLGLGGLMMAVGLAFKLSAVPFHFWCPDVFEGASAEVAAFLSISSKAAALALLLRVALGFGAAPLDAQEVAAPHGVRTSQIQLAALTQIEGEGEHADGAADAETSDDEAADADTAATELAAGTAGPHAVAELAPVRNFIALLIAFIAAITCTFGNLAAYAQTNIKRLMAYSTIAHAGYMMMPFPAILALAGAGDVAGARSAAASLAIYIGIYLFMNLGAFAVIAFVRNAQGSEEIADYAGLIRRSPLLAVCFVAILFSLIGLPPLAGFVGKFAVFAALVDGYRITGGAYLMALLVIGGLNTVVSLFYYLRIVKTMTFDPIPADAPPAEFGRSLFASFYVVVITAPLIGLFLFWNSLSELAQAAARHLLS